jgi:hypothetical protein
VRREADDWVRGALAADPDITRTADGSAQWPILAAKTDNCGHRHYKGQENYSAVTAVGAVGENERTRGKPHAGC